MTKFYFTRLWQLAIFLFLFSACDSSDDFMIDTDVEETPEPPPEIEPTGYLAPITLPDTIKLTYGEDFYAELPEDYKDQNVSFEMLFNHENINITDNKNLEDVLDAGIVIDTLNNQFSIRSQELYPNNFSSSITGKRLPEAYEITLTASAYPTFLPVSKTFFVKIAPAQIDIDEMDNELRIPFAYQMYGTSDSITYHLSTHELDLENTQWELHQNGRPDGKVFIENNQISFDENAGDPDQEAEWTYDLIASLSRDGFTLATRQFRVRFILEIKFLYGTFYPDLDLTILTNRLHIALHENYQSPAPNVYPAQYKQSFSILNIQKDGAAFTNEAGIISIDQKTGQIAVAHNHSLTAGEYLIKVQAETTVGLTFETDITLVMSPASEDAHDH